jgi:hypothetical protein
MGQLPFPLMDMTLQAIPTTISAAQERLRHQYTLPFTVGRSLNQLAPYRPPITLKQAQTQIAALWDHIVLLALYQDTFPDAFAVSVADLYSDESSLFSPREWEFMELINRHRFPLDLDLYSIEEERRLMIPIFPCGISL